ncbi:hypothetical protein HYH03_009837 [Edaphochlamys debaryana]|uniref:lipoyl(octanoyl) transferase n=1 Tax=Edaphochlamys debaryana TaxID=47281 RepID=A0A835Y3I8_9CHLO|nr:hypothetical protein HYH03_009837 [Edaphochlamys debaryana]|eukprot:KAG2491885.1 hypothetical protein HYH03_009837 [Edaphochlamys debaryana]
MPFPCGVTSRRGGRVGAAAAAAAAADQEPSTSSAAVRTVTVYDLSDRVVDYEQAWAWQKALLARAVASADAGSPRGARDCVLLLQHPPVLTLGAGSTLDNLRFPPGSPPVPLYRTERGGEVTYHGPGQLVMYPIVDLQALRPDLHWYLRQLEEVVIGALDAVSGLAGQRELGLTGVWVEGAKVAAIGVRAKKWVTYHGLALNVVTDLAPFGWIVPCGIEGRPVTSVARLLRERQAAEDPFAGDALAQSAATDGGAAPDMLPLAEASQDDLRRLLAQAGASPLMLHDAGSTAPPSTTASTAGGDGAYDPWADDDPFAASLSSLPPPASPTPLGGEALGAAAAAQGGAAAGGGAGAGQQGPPEVPGEAGVAAALGLRHRWSPAEALLLREYACALLEAFEGAFGVRLVPGDPRDLDDLA